MHVATGDWTGSLHHRVGCVAATLKMARRQMTQVSSATMHQRDLLLIAQRKGDVSNNIVINC